MHKPPGLADPKQAYSEHNRHFRIASFKVGCVLVLVLMPAGGLLDYFVYYDKLGFFFTLRMLCSLLALILWGLLNTRLGQAHFRTMGMLCFILPSLFISLMIYFADGVASSYYAGLNLVLIGMTWAAQVEFTESIIASLLTVLMYVAACYAHGPVNFSLLFTNLYFVVLTGIIVVTGSYYVNRLRFREFALRAEVDSSRKELEVSNLKLVEMDRAKSEFFANISHELRTPLTLLIGPLERLRTDLSGSLAGPQSELLDIMYGNAMRLLRLINDLLSLVRLDSGALVLRKEKIELKPFIEGLAQSVTPMARQCQLSFSTRVEAPDETVVHLDRDKFEKIVYNLLFNAFKFTPPEGSVAFSAGVEGRSPRGDGEGFRRRHFPAGPRKDIRPVLAGGSVDDPALPGRRDRTRAGEGAGDCSRRNCFCRERAGQGNDDEGRDQCRRPDVHRAGNGFNRSRHQPGERSMAEPPLPPGRAFSRPCFDQARFVRGRCRATARRGNGRHPRRR